MKKTVTQDIPIADRLALVSAPLFALQWPIVHSLHPQLPLPWEPLLTGIAIFASAYLLAWAAEVAEVDIPPALALTLLSLVTVMPEYTVDIYFAWKGGQDSAYVPYAVANMTGGNRLLIGLGWALVVLVYAWKCRQKEVVLEPRLRLETAVLLAATLYSLVIPLKGSLSLWDTLVFFAIFAFYFLRILENRAREPKQEGLVAVIQGWPPSARRAFSILFFGLAAWTLYLSAHPFAEGLLALGRRWNIEEFILVQWLAPLVSESPEFIVAVLFALRANPTSSFNTVVSSTINQWTLLVGALPLAYVLSKGSLAPMPLDSRQIEEIFLTSAQSLFGVVVLSNLRFSLWEALAIFTLFATQCLYPLFEPWVGVPSDYVRVAYAWVYIGIAAAILVFSARTRDDFKALAGVFLKPGAKV